MKNTGILLLLLFCLYSCNNSVDESDAYGNFESIPVIVSAEGQGQILQLNIEEGDQLEEGQEAGVIDTTMIYLKKEQLLTTFETFRSRIAGMDAQIKAQQVQLSNLEREAKRVRALLKDGAATQKQLDDIEGSIELIKAQVSAINVQKNTIRAEERSLEAQLLQILEQINKSFIYNPIKGTVLQKFKQAGEIVATGQPVYKVADLANLVLRVYISENQLSTVKTGQEVTVRFDEQDGIGEIPGTITWISSQAEFTPKIIQTREERVNLVYAMKVKVVNDGRLKIGMPGEIKL